jgi:hypothetical protein
MLAGEGDDNLACGVGNQPFGAHPCKGIGHLPFAFGERLDRYVSTSAKGQDGTYWVAALLEHGVTGDGLVGSFESVEEAQE